MSLKQSEDGQRLILLPKTEYDSMNSEIRELVALLTTICKTAASNLEKGK